MEHFSIYIFISSIESLLKWIVCFMLELRQRQEMIMRNQMMAVNSQLMGAGPQRIQTIPSQFEPRFVERYSSLT